MNTDTSMTATIQRLSDDLTQMEQENIQLRQQIIKLEENSIADMNTKGFKKCRTRFSKEHPVQSILNAMLFGFYVGLLLQIETIASIFKLIFTNL